MKYSFLSLFILVSFVSYSQEFYDLNEIQTIEINFAESNWDQLLDQAYANETGYILAQNISINGVVFDSVGVKYKGNSTYNPNQLKNPFHIELDTYKEQDYQGYKDIKLSNIDKDPSFLREVLSYHILRKYMVAPLSNFANVYVNGDLIGIYSNSESITKTFTKTHFDSKGNAFIKCNPPAGAGPQANDFPNLEYLGSDSTAYYEAYEMKTDFGWNELIDLCDALNNNTDAIEEILDVDKALWMLAYNNVLVNLDSYIGAFKQNYYLYRDDYGRFLPIIWDLNESFGRFSSTGSSNLSSTIAKQQMSHLLHANDADFPLVQHLLSNPTYKKMYLAHFKTILLENFDNGDYYDIALSLKELIDESVQNDPNKIYSYSNFSTNLDSDVSGGGGPMGGAVPGLANLMDGRSDYLLGLSDFTQTEPIIDNITTSTPNPVIGENIFITADINEANVALFGYRNNLHAPFMQLPMMDDGLHNDGGAGDGVFGVEFSVEGAFVQYYIYAENENIGKFSPVRAKHEYYTITATTIATEVGDLVINEFLASNDNTAADQDGEFDDWIELYNNGEETIDITGYFLSDDVGDLMKWEFPEGTEINSHDYLTIWADNDTDQVGLHASFKLSATAESIFLVDPSGEVVDEVSFVNQQTDISYGRYPNGIGDFREMNPTFGAENVIISNVEDNKASMDFIAYPNPAKDFIKVVHNDSNDQRIVFYNILGEIVYDDNFSREVTVDISNWRKGVYFIKCNDVSRKILVF